MLQRLLSAWIWTATTVLVIVWLPWLTRVFLATAPFDPGRYTAGRWFRRAAMVAVAINPLWRFRTSGVRIDDPRIQAQDYALFRAVFPLASGEDE